MVPPPPVFQTSWRGIGIAVFATDDRSPLSLPEVESILCAEEHDRAARFHFEKDRSRWIRSRAVLRLHLAATLDRPAGSLVFADGPQGKPFLPDHPGFHFNLSHSGDLVAIATGAHPAGIDIERIQPELGVIALSEHAFLPRESAEISADRQPGILFHRLWSAKEAVMKCTGLGMNLPPSEITVSLPGETATRRDNGETFALLSLLVLEEYALAAAVHGP